MKYILAKCMTLMTTMLLLLSLTLQTEARHASINVNLAMNVSEDSHQLSEDMVRICAQETDISMDELHKLRQQDFKNSTEATQCFVHCIYEQMGLLHYGIFVKRDVIRTLADATDPQSFAVYKECHGLRGANKCETAYKIHQCRRQHDMREDSAMVPPTTTAAPTGGAQAVEGAASGAALKWSASMH